MSEVVHTEKSSLGFWIYLMTDCLLFGSLFATFVVLRGGPNGLNGGPGGAELFHLPFVLVETIILLVSSMTVGLALLMARHGKRAMSLGLLIATIALGLAFLTMELTEFHQLVVDGASWQRSAFLSAFFTLVGTHGAHITVGLIWQIVLTARYAMQGSSPAQLRRLTLAAMFWHFLDVIWIFIFTIVYLMGVL